MPQKGTNKTFANKRTINPPTTGSRSRTNMIDAPQQQDAKRRLGGFQGRGEHARTTVRSTEKR